jgi:hypothetical protein
VTAHAFRRRALTFGIPATADRQAEHVQVPVVHLFASEILERAALASVMATMDLLPEARSCGACLERRSDVGGSSLRCGERKCRCGGGEKPKRCAPHLNSLSK